MNTAPDTSRMQPTKGEYLNVRFRPIFGWFALGVWIYFASLVLLSWVFQGWWGLQWSALATPPIVAILSAALFAGWLRWHIRGLEGVTVRWRAFPFLAGLLLPLLATLIFLPVAHIPYLPRWFYYLWGVSVWIAICLGSAEFFARLLLSQWKLQFSLRGLLLLVTLFAALMGTVGVKLLDARRQHVEQRAIVEGWAEYGASATFNPAGEVLTLGFRWTQCQRLGDDALKEIGKLDQLEYLHLCGSQVSDDGLRYLAGLKKLKRLNLGSSKRITDAGLIHLSRLTALEDLTLLNTSVSDAGLAHLRGLTSLKKLSLDGCPVTVKTLKSLQEVLPHTSIIHSALQNRDDGTGS